MTDTPPAANDAPAEAAKTEAAVTEAATGSPEAKRKLYQFFTHDAEGVFHGKRTAGFAAGAVVVAGGAYLLSRSKGGDRTQYENSAALSV